MFFMFISEGIENNLSIKGTAIAVPELGDVSDASRRTHKKVEFISHIPLLDEV